MRKAAGWVLALMAAASVASASNMAYSVRVLVPAGPQAMHLLSVPWLHDYGTAEGLCTALGGVGTIDEVLRWDDTTSTFEAHPCGTATNDFALVPGEAYGFSNVAWEEVDARIAGRHEPDIDLVFPHTSGGNMHWVSMPHHLALPDLAGTPDVADAEDLCLLAGDGLLAVVRWADGSQLYRAWICGSALDTPFAVEPGAAYGLINAEGRQLEWHPPHF